MEEIAMPAWNPAHDLGDGRIFTESPPSIKCSGMDFKIGDVVRFNMDFENEYMYNTGEKYRFSIVKNETGILICYPWYGIARVGIEERNKKHSIIDIPSSILSPPMA